MIELSHLYNEVAELVHQQEPAVQQIQQGAEETHRNVEQANTKLDSAIQSAKNARRWKWYALIIVSKLLSASTLTLELLANPFPVIIIAIVVGVAVGVTQANKSTKP